ncbi:MAG: hypothetical protein WCY89_01225 [Flavobacteriaceae bacterium]
MSTQTHSQNETIKKMVERLNAFRNQKTGEFEVKTELTQTGENTYYLTMCQTMSLIRVCKGAIYHIAEQRNQKEVNCYDVINVLELAEQLNDRVMSDIDILDTLSEFEVNK